MTFHIFYGMECQFKLDTLKNNKNKNKIINGENTKLLIRQKYVG